MDKYSDKNGSKALQTVALTINNCQEMQRKFAEGISQHTLLKNRIKALEISKSLLSNENIQEKYSKQELYEALCPVSSVICKCEKALTKFDEGTAHYSRLRNLIDAMNRSKSLITEAIKKMESQSIDPSAVTQDDRQAGIHSPSESGTDGDGIKKPGADF